MIQQIKSPIALPVLDAAPTLADAGAALESGRYRRSKYIATLTLAGGTTLEVITYLLVNGVWGLASELGITTALLGGSALASDKVSHYELDGLGIATRIALVKGDSPGGAVTASATIALVRERNT